MTKPWQCRKCGSTERYASNGRCAPCQRRAASARRAANPEKDAAYRAANPGYGALYRAANSEKITAGIQAWRAANPGKYASIIRRCKRRFRRRKATDKDYQRLMAFIDEQGTPT